MGESYCIITRNALPAPLAPVSAALAQATGRVAFDITRELHESSGVLPLRLTRDEATRAVQALAAIGVGAFALAESEFVEFPPPVFLETARLGEDALDVADLRDAKERPLGAVNLPYKDIVLIAAAHVRTRKDKKIFEPQRVGDEIETVVRTEATWSQTCYLDLFAVDPAHHLRLNTATFNFIQTGLRMQATSVANLAQFVRWLSVKCGQEAVDAGVSYLLDNNPATNLRFNSLVQYDAYLRWRIQLLYHPE